MDGKSMFGDIKSKLGFGRKNDYEEFYEDYDQLENGVGMMRLFEDEFRAELDRPHLSLIHI